MVTKPAPGKIAELAPQPGKAVLVISRTTSFGGAIAFRTYVDKKFIGSTRAKCYFVKKDIEPGQHYVSFWAENGVAVKFNFEAGKVYCLQQNVSMGAFRARVVAEALAAKRLDSGDLSGCAYYEFDPSTSPERDLSDEELADVIKGADTYVLNPDGTAELVSEKKK